MYPRNEEVAAILGDVSTVISMTDEAEFAALITLSSLLAPFYHLQHAAEMWARAQGVKQEVASQFVGEMFAAIAADWKNERGGFAHMTRLCQTPAGINEQALEGLKGRGFYSMLQAQLDVVFARVSNSKSE